MKALSELFDETTIVVPFSPVPKPKGEVPFIGHNIRIVPLENIDAVKGNRKLRFPIWLLKNSATILRLINQADAVHVPIPSDMGTIPMVLANMMGKPLYVRHCGNWFIQATKAEKFWKWFMEKKAGGKNVMLATGGAATPPSSINKNIDWIFSTSLTTEELEALKGSEHIIRNNAPKLIIACRQEKEKGVDTVLQAMHLLKSRYPDITLDVLGDGEYIPQLQDMAASLELTEQVIFHKKVGHDRVIELMQAADIFTYPTRASEGFPKVVLEAMASGLPVITNPVSVLPQLLSTGGGILMKHDTPQELADDIEYMIIHPQEYRVMQQKAQDIVKKFSLENWRDTIGTHLKKAWNRPLQEAHVR